MKALKKTLQRGDTIVEVMIAMAVLGLVLASAFAISNRSYATGINAQERNEALKVAESQVELLRIASTLTDESIIDADPSRLFCIEPSGAKLERIEFASGAVVEDQGELDETQYPTIGAIDGDCNFGTSDRYYVSIQQSADIDDETNQPTGGQIFSVRVYWESIFGGFSNVVNHEYRTYNFEGTFSLVSPVTPTLPIIAQPSAQQTSVSNISKTTATVTSSVTGNNVTKKGFIFVLGNNQNVEDGTSGAQNRSLTALEQFGAELTGLTPNSLYTVRSYVVSLDTDQVYYGPSKLFTTTNNYTVGDTGPGGGKVFYAKRNISNGWRYMEAFDSNVASYMDCKDVSYGLGFQVDDGLTNTNKHTAQCGDGSPFGYASSFTRNSLDDWFLPSYYELKKLYQNKTTAGINFTGIYWGSSTNADANYFWGVNLADDSHYGGAYAGSSTQYKIVVVRRF
jgi:prepilin-type N-terminal cleavage/methylation domain-containing protein